MFRDDYKDIIIDRIRFCPIAERHCFHGHPVIYMGDHWKYGNWSGAPSFIEEIDNPRCAFWDIHCNGKGFLFGKDV